MKKSYKPKGKPSRKQVRKEQRIQKKVKKNEYFQNKKKAGQFVKALKDNVENEIKKAPKQPKKESLPTLDQLRNKELEQEKKLQKQVKKIRNKQLLLANKEEDRNIKKLEKQLKLNKRKSKAIPKSFCEDGLDYLLEVCDPEQIKDVVSTEQHLYDVGEGFEEDLALMNGSNKVSGNNSEDNEDMDEEEATDLSEIESNEESSDEEEFKAKRVKFDLPDPEDSELEDDELTDNDSNPENNDLILENDQDSEVEDDSKFDAEDSDPESDSDDQSQNKSVKGAAKVNPDGTWEDIYGRLRDKNGSFITKSDKYIPPAVRLKMEQDKSTDKKQIEKMNRLKKMLKGLLNRLAESNMHGISSQIENNYMHNSRNDMNETLTNLILESVVTNILAPERLLMEHVLLIVILHANVGTEVGAHFLQVVVNKFNDFIGNESEGKMLENIVLILAQLYNFKLYDSKLIYEVLHKLSEIFTEKNIDCILHILKSVGFNLRRDDPLALKNLILELQKKAATASEGVVNGSRVKFLLDILLAIKNNNVSKIPNYDNAYSEHLKKIMKGFIRKGNYVTQLNISLEDLLKAEEKGRWWVVGSAWTGNVTENTEVSTKPKNTFSEKLLKIARKQRMNTDTRRNIFCVIMTAEDYLDAFEKLLHLGLPAGQDREIIHVLLHCCLQEKSYNPYYSYLAQKLCDYDRKYQLAIKFSIWDKLKAINEQSLDQLSNLAKLLIHLILQKGLPISTLKIVEFNELDKITLRFIRQILLGILLHENLEEVREVFDKIAQSDKLKMFRESLRLFIHHFLLKNLNSIDEKQKELLETRAKIVEKLLTVKDKLRF